MRSINKLELLAPAKNLECGIAAIHHGADAVYIGAPKFGAREAAGNSIGEIEKLAAEARIFGAKTYVALNTILYDNELEEAQRIIKQVYEAGADALIIQDFGILEMDLPPISLHASTQANNFTVDKIKFLEAVGFKRAVLARELSLSQITEIAAQTTIELEAFVHGSLCVSLSGQCYMSQVVGGRSANRGACAQPCRKKYTLSDANGKVIVKDKHLLSLKDLNRSDSISELAEAGVRSFKIEGRLKDVDYVKNITAHYRQELDHFLEGKAGYIRASKGKTTFYFLPDPAKTFHRGATEYYLRGRTDPVSNFESNKSTGEEMGIVTRISRDSLQISGEKTVNNNDGLTFVGRDGENAGLKVNKVANGWVYPDRMNDVFVGAKVFRNWDQSFQMALQKKTSERKIPLSIALQEVEEGFILMENFKISEQELYNHEHHSDEIHPETVLNQQNDDTIHLTTGMDQHHVGTSPHHDSPKQQSSPTSFKISISKIMANDPEKSRENILRQLSKSGDTAFLVSDIDTGGNEKYFFTSQQLNELRRGLLEILLDKSVSGKSKGINKRTPENPVKANQDGAKIPFPEDPWHFENNISNQLAMQFYKRHGLENPETSVETRKLSGRTQVMITKHCLQYELGFCARFGGTFPSQFSEPFALQDGTNKFELEFDCKNCMMKIFKG
ncbi:MAG: U32 family peptidase [Prolixibacteraceae bacterium]